MHKNFLIFFFLFFSGTGVSNMFEEARSDLAIDKNLIGFDVDTECESRLIAFLSNPPELDEGSFFVSGANKSTLRKIQSTAITSTNYFRSKINRKAQRQLFLLFHSFLFYDI